jgi:hypothetical protein
VGWSCDNIPLPSTCGLNDGEVCVGDGDCFNGHCPADDLICCDMTCGGVCESCDAAKTGGTDGMCDFVSAASDPDLECPGAMDCDGAGACI